MEESEISTESKSEVVETFYLETHDGLYFAVKGHEHPPGRWIGILRYVPDPDDGDRIKDGKIYRRLYRFREQEQWIRSAYPHYQSFDPIFQASLQSVPGTLVRRIYDPRLRLQEMVCSAARTAIEEDALAFAELLQKESGVSDLCLGVTGSLLIGLHTDASDLDLVVFGARNCRLVYQAMQKLLATQSCADLRRLNSREMEDLYIQRSADTRMSLRSFMNLESRKVNQGIFRGRTYFIRFVKFHREAGWLYGDRRYERVGRASIIASICDDRDAIFTPCRYLLSNVCSTDGSRLPDMSEMVSFRGRFCEQAKTSENIFATGTLERVRDRQGHVWHRLLIGNSPDDTMLVRQSGVS